MSLEFQKEPYTEKLNNITFKVKMTKFSKLFTFVLLLLTFLKCSIYSFTGASIPEGTKTFQVNYFENIAGNRPGSTVEPGLDQVYNSPTRFNFKSNQFKFSN